MFNARRGYIPEIQGLRTVALLMVATFHIWFDRVSGGVDVFLLVSAYLLTRSFTTLSERGIVPRPAAYLVHKFSRLLPAAATTIVLILLGVFLFMPTSYWSGALGDSVGSLFYVQNIRLQEAAVDYFDPNNALASPFQHFWSLSVQGQVFVLFALLHLAGDLSARGLNLPVRSVLLAIFVLVGVMSFVYSIWLTGENQVYAYFDTGARVWEFAAGSLLALMHPWIRVGPAFQVGASWVGVIALLTCGFVLPVESSFPGWGALWPVTAASLVILSAGAPTKFGADRFLSHGLMRRLGDYTYALYLTHWPVLVLFLWTAGIEYANWWQGLIILVTSGVLSVVVVHGVERPVAKWVKGTRTKWERWRPPKMGWRAPVVIVTSVALVLGLVGMGTFELRRVLGQGRAEIDALPIAELGANALPGQKFDEEPVPAEGLVTGDWVHVGADCPSEDPYWTHLCYEIPAVGAGIARTVYAVGSSHSTQFNGALLEAVNRHPSWTFRTQLAAGCYYQSREGVGEECVALWDQAAAYIAAEKPDLVVLFGTQTYLDFEMTQPDFVDWLARASAASPRTQFVTVRDNPRSAFSPFDCAIQHGYESDRCVFSIETDTPPDYIAELEAAGAIWVDLNDYICPGRECRPSQGSVVTYLDESHLTGTYARTLAQRFSDAITPEVTWWPQRVYEEGVYQNRAWNDDVLEDLNR